MTNVKEIETAIKHLPNDKLTEFRKWFDEFDATQWDKQFVQDIKSGKLNNIAGQVLKIFKKNRCTEL